MIHSSKYFICLRLNVKYLRFSNWKMQSEEFSSQIMLSRAEKAIAFFNAARTSLDELLNHFEGNKDAHEDIPELLKTYGNFREDYRKCLDMEKKFPLIVLEGLDGSGKTTVGKRLAKQINAERVTTPAKSLSFLRPKFDGHYCCHAPFYYFGNYVAAMEVSEILQEKPVVMDRFWHSTTAFALAQMKEDYSNVTDSVQLPDEGSNVYQWPDDLLKPDIVILLDISEDVRNQRLSRRKIQTDQEKLLTSKQEFRKSVLLAYDNMKNPKVEKVKADLVFKHVLQEIHDKMKHLF